MAGEVRKRVIGDGSGTALTASILGIPTLYKVPRVQEVEEEQRGWWC